MFKLLKRCGNGLIFGGEIYYATGVNMKPAFKRALELAKEIENFPLNRCPFDDADAVSAYQFRFQELIHPFLAAIKRINDPSLSANIRDVDQNPGSLEDMVQSRAVLKGVIDGLRELSQRQEEYDHPVSMSLREYGSEEAIEEITKEWSRLLRRKKDDPEGVLSSAKNMIESTCKYILDHHKEEYNDKNIKLPMLYKNAAEKLNMYMKQEDERIKKILGACATIVDSFSELRNDYGDSHGKGKRSKKIKIHCRHLEFITNIAGAMSIFLLKINKEKGFSK